MRVLGIMLSLAILAFVVYVAVTFYLDFRKVPGTTTERLLIAARDSATVLWAKFCILVAGPGLRRRNRKRHPESDD